MVREQVEEYLRNYQGNITEKTTDSTEYSPLEEAYQKLEPVFQDILFLFYMKREPWVKISLRLNYCPSHCRNLRNKALEELARELKKSASENFPKE